MLALILKGKWYDMIRSGEKLEEYREIKEYYTARFRNIGLLDEKGKPTTTLKSIVFRRGYGKNAPRMVCLCRCFVGRGWPSWGAMPNATYYVLRIYCRTEVEPGVL